MGRRRRGATPGLPGEANQEALSRFDDHLRRISTALYGTGMLAVLLVANTGLVRPDDMDRAPLNWIVFAAGLSVAGILLFPWHRYNRELFLAATLDSLLLIALAVYFSGGWASPFYPFYFFVVIFCALYHSPSVAALAVSLTVLTSLSPQLYAPDASRLAEHLVVQVPSYVAVALASWYMAREVGRREHLRGEHERRFRAMRELKDRFQREAYTDRLTGLPNRIRFEARLHEELEGRRRSGDRCTLVLLDVDDSKGINDVHRHATGDESLRLVADALRRNVRDADLVARHGGEEFTVLLPGASPYGARDFFGRIREEVQHRSKRELGFPLHLSAGAASFPEDARDPYGLVDTADAAMHRAKRLGKDRLFHPSLGGD
jgi:diguanylate cyclase (GGDEF)-like protein